jgi:xylulokinase
MELLIGLDIGTSSVKGVLVTSAGKIIASAKRLNNLIRGENDNVELDPVEHIDTVFGLIAELVSKTPADGRIRGISMAAASGNTMLADEKGKPLTKIISWLDRRMVGQLDSHLPDSDFSDFHEIAGWPKNEVFPLAHLAWFRANQPDVYKQTAHFCMNSDYLLYRLCGEWAIDPSTSTTFFLYNQKNNQWHKPYLEMLDIPEEAMPRIFPSGTPAGKVTAEAARRTGLPKDTKIVLGAFDHPCAARGIGLFEAGRMMLSCGTSWVPFFPYNDRNFAVEENLLIDPYLSKDGLWGMMYSLPGLGVNIDQYVEHVILSSGEAFEDRYTIFNDCSAHSVIGAHGLFLQPVPMGTVPQNRLAELKQNKDRNDVARAAMESAAFEMRLKISEFGKKGVATEQMTMVGGPSESRVWTQIVADVTELPIRLINGQTAGAMGAAILAGIGSGIFKNEKEGFSAMGGTPHIVEPESVSVTEYNGIYKFYMEKTRG